MSADRVLQITGAGKLEFIDGAGFVVDFKTPAGLAGDYTIELPDADGGAGEILQTNGAGKWSWVAAGAGTIGGAGTAGFVPMFTGPLVIGDSLILCDGVSVGIQAVPSAQAVVTIDDNAGETNVVRINASLGLGAAIDVQQAGDVNALLLNKTGAGVGDVASITNAGTGYGMRINQNGGQSALYLDQNGADYAAHLSANFAGAGGISVSGALAGLPLIHIGNDSTAQIALDIVAQVNSGQAIYIVANAGHGSPVVQIQNAGAGKGIHVDNTMGAGGQIGVHIEQANDTYGCLITQTGAQAGLYVIQSALTGHGVWVHHSNVGAGSHGVYVNDDGQGRGLFIDKSGSGYGLFVLNVATGGSAVRVENSAGVVGVSVVQSGAGVGFNLTQSGAATGVLISKTTAAGSCLSMTSDQGTDVCTISSNADGADGLYVGMNNDNGRGVHIRTAGDAHSALFLDVNGASHGLEIDYDGSGHGSIVVNHNGDTDVMQLVKPSVGAGDMIQLNNSGTGMDIKGTGSHFTVSADGAVKVSGLQLDSSVETIDAAGAITIGYDQSYIRVDTFGAAASDNLDTITGGQNGQVIVLQAYDAARTVVCRHNIGNLRNTASNPQTMADEYDKATYIYNGQTGTWDMLSFSGN